MIRVVRLVLIVMIFFIFSSCLREPLPPENKIVTTLEPDIFATFCNAKKGSKFIYERERDGALDTATVTSYSDAKCVGKEEAEDKENYTRRYRQCVFISYRTQKNWGADIRVTALKSDSARIDFMGCGDRIRYKGVWNQGNAIDSMKIGNRVFYNVLHFEFGCGADEEMFFVKDIGIVRKVYNYQEIYNLKDWQIIN